MERGTSDIHRSQAFHFQNDAQWVIRLRLAILNIGSYFQLVKVDIVSLHPPYACSFDYCIISQVKLSRFISIHHSGIPIPFASAAFLTSSL